MFLPRKSELAGISVLNTPDSASISVNNGKATITGIGEAIPLDSNVLSFKRAVHSTGTAQVTDLDFSAIVINADGSYTLKFKKDVVANTFSVVEDETVTERVYVVQMSGSHVAADVVTAAIAKINADPSKFFTASNSSGLLRCTAPNATYGFVVKEKPSGVTVANSTQWVEPKGTETIVNSYLAGSAAAAGTYTTYVLEALQNETKNYVNGVIKKVRRFVIFAKNDATNYAEFDALATTILGNVHGDGALKGKLGATRKAVAAVATLNGTETVVTCSGTTYALTLAPAATFGQGLLFVKNGASGNVTLTRSGSDTIDGGTTKVVATTVGNLLYCDGVSAYVTVLP